MTAFSFLIAPVMCDLYFYGQMLKGYQIMNMIIMSHLIFTMMKI